METLERNIPEKRFSTGAINVTVWRNAGQTDSGEATEYRTVSFDRRYKDKKGEWKSTNSLRINDLPKAVIVLNKAFEYLTLKGIGEDAAA